MEFAILLNLCILLLDVKVKLVLKYGGQYCWPVNQPLSSKNQLGNRELV